MGDAHFALGALAESAHLYAAAAARAQQAGLKTAQLQRVTSTMYPLGFIDPGQGVAAVEEAVKISMSANDPPRLALTQMLAAGFRLVFDSWSQTDAELCTSAYETLVRLHPSELDPYQGIVYAHILMLKGNYGEALELCERSVSEASASGVGQVVNFLAHFGALSAKIIVLLHTGNLGKCCRLRKPAEHLRMRICHYIGYLPSAKHGFAPWLSTSRVQGEFVKRAVMRGESIQTDSYYAIDQIAA